MASWTTIESDPGVFTALVEAFGVKGVEFTELYSLDEESFADLTPYGLIFLFKWTGEDKDDTREATAEPPAGLFCAKQMVSNACATQAILGVLLNLEERQGLALGSTLSELRTFSADLPYDMRGLAIENSEAIRTAHNSFARPEPFVSEEKLAGKDDDVFHFVAYVPFRGRVYELDGLRNGPIDLGSFEFSWVSVARAAVAARVEKYAASEIKFNLMAVVRDKRHVLEDQRAQLAGNEVGLLEVEHALAQEVAKREAWAAENDRRRHNYVPLVVDLFKVLAEKQLLADLVAKAGTGTGSSGGAPAAAAAAAGK
eukprot:CAMPEP_0198661092 /NCGR_PEP_ID=MMETSP1467-20131203/39969_1 /TAXON_ID=1462469 /ORGANISM="unid. sp., Strain CCMP2135" /LENGTH=312 /DNA_ID=CAMNT_0044397515 /DNA_START=42 /DNA_END=980 /DNA_ORIENTATION=-